MPHRAIFLDRDDTLIHDPGFLDDPERVRLLPGVAEALRRLRAAGHRLLVVSNQSGIARGLFDEDQLAQVHDRLRALLAEEGVALDDICYCPYLEGEAAVVEAYRRDSELRKPRPGMLHQAARKWDLDLSRSWMIGDRMSDVEAGQAAGCRTILVGTVPQRYNGHARPNHVVRTVLEAARIVEEQEHSQTNAGERITDPRQLELLSEIRDALNRRERLEGQEDFSLRRLVASLAQMLAVAVALWGIIGLFGGQTGSAIARFSLAVFLQLVTLTLHLAERDR